MPVALPKHLRPLLWDSKPSRIDVVRDAEYLMARVLEFGTMVNVRWLFRRYGAEAIHAFLKNAAHPELSARTINFWRIFFRAERETWRKPPAFRRRKLNSWLEDLRAPRTKTSPF